MRGCGLGFWIIGLVRANSIFKSNNRASANLGKIANADLRRRYEIGAVQNGPIVEF